MKMIKLKLNIENVFLILYGMKTVADMIQDDAGKKSIQVDRSQYFRSGEETNIQYRDARGNKKPSGASEA